MLRTPIVALVILAISAVFAAGEATATSPCTVPNQLTNGQTADASQVMGNFNAVADCVNNAPGGSANSIQLNSGSGFSGVGPLTNGQLLVGSTGNPPQPATLTAGTGISITNDAGSVIITATGGGGTAYDPVILAESSLTHYWPMSDAAGSTSLADVKGNAPMPITDTVSNVVLGQVGLINDGTTGAAVLGRSTKTNGIITIPGSVLPATGNYTVEFMFKPFGYLGTQSYALSGLLYMDFYNSLDLYIDNGRFGIANELRGPVAGGSDSWRSAMSLGPNTTYHIAIVADATTNTMTRYLNGLPLPIKYSGTIGRQNGVGQLGSYPRTVDSNYYAFMGIYQKFAIYNTALPASTIAAHYAATGLR